MALDPVTAGIDAVTTIVNKIWPDKSQQEKDQLAAAMQLIKAQTDANAAEAAQPGVHFRDGAGWVCVISFAIVTLKAPIEWASALTGHPVTLPSVDTSVTYPMLLGLLGLGGMHATEQIMGTK